MFKYDPYQKSDEQIIATFVSGSRYLDDLLADLRPRNGQRSNQCVLILGKRGQGKSHFLKMLHIRVSSDETLREHYLPIFFPEESFKAASLYHFLRDALSRVFKELARLQGVGAPEVMALRQEYQDLCRVSLRGAKKEQAEARRRVEEAFFRLLASASAQCGRTLIFLLENLQDLLGSRFQTDDLKRLRAFLQTETGSLLIIGTAVEVFGQLENYGAPFYNFFQLRRLADLDTDEMMRLLVAEARERKNQTVLDRIGRHRSAIEVFRLLTGGTPRLVLVLYDLLAESENLAVEDILKKITELTPYFKAETEVLTPIKQLIMDALCDGAPARTATEIGEYMNESPGIVHENLRRLAAEGKVRPLDTERGEGVKGSETFYTVADYLYRIWYQIRQAVCCDDNLRWMAELAVLLFDEETLAQKASQGGERLKTVFSGALALARDTAYMERLRTLMAMETEPMEGDGDMERLKALVKKKDWQGLLADTAMMIQQEKELAAAWFYQGLAQHYLGQPVQAADAYEKSLAIKPDVPSVLNNLGSSYVLLGNYGKAIESYEKALAIDPDYPEALYNLSLSYSKLGDPARAMDALQRCARIAQEFPSLTLWGFEEIKAAADKVFVLDDCLSRLTDSRLALKERLDAAGNLLLLGRFNGIETIVASLIATAQGLAPADVPVESLRALSFCLMHETILRLQGKAAEPDPGLTARHFLAVAALLPDRSIEARVREFLLNYLENTEAENLNVEGLREIAAAWEKMDVVLPEAVTALVEALHKPRSRAAQVWSADPLFRALFMRLRKRQGKKGGESAGISSPPG